MSTGPEALGGGTGEGDGAAESVANRRANDRAGERSNAVSFAKGQASTGLPPVPGMPSPTAVAWYRVARAIVYVPTWLMWRFRVVGRENLPQTTPYVVAPTHRSYIDTLLVGCMIPRRVRFMAKSGVFDNAFAAKLFGSLGGFPVRRGTPDREALRNSESALAEGEPVVLYPEGGRRYGPVVGKLLDGPAFLALRANVPIVPVGVGGTEAAMPVGAHWPRPGRVVLVVGKPIWPPPVPASGRVPRRVVQELTERLRSELQVAFDRARELAEEASSLTPGQQRWLGEESARRDGQEEKSKEEESDGVQAARQKRP